jgi:hypothetical protein
MKAEDYNAREIGRSTDCSFPLPPSRPDALTDIQSTYHSRNLGSPISDRGSSRSNVRHPAVSRTSNNEESGEIIGTEFIGGAKKQ